MIPTLDRQSDVPLFTRFAGDASRHIADEPAVVDGSQRRTERRHARVIEKRLRYAQFIGLLLQRNEREVGFGGGRSHADPCLCPAARDGGGHGTMVGDDVFVALWDAGAIPRRTSNARRAAEPSSRLTQRTLARRIALADRSRRLRVDGDTGIPTQLMEQAIARPEARSNGLVVRQSPEASVKCTPATWTSPCLRRASASVLDRKRGSTRTS